MNKKRLFLILFLITFNPLSLSYWMFFDKSLAGILQILSSDLIVLVGFLIFLRIRRRRKILVERSRGEKEDELFAFRSLFSEGGKL